MRAKVDEALKDIDIDNKNYIVELTTTKGPIRLTFFPEKAPGHVKNFLGLTKTGFYDNVVFHRIIRGFMIQGGDPEGTGTGGPGYRVNAEFNDTPHVTGVLSMARTNDPDSAGSQFFICLGQHTHLDRQYTAFGKVAGAESLQTVKTIGEVQVGAQDRPREDVKIIKAEVKEIA